MKTLVYFASGPNKTEYQDLDFDQIYLIDNFFKKKQQAQIDIFNSGKVFCIGMDCIQAVNFLRKQHVKIDCFVSLNEGLYEGGGRYAINSDFFIGYAMSLFKDNYIHIMNKAYYQNKYKVSMDLPFIAEELNQNDTRYISPSIFSKNSFHKGNAKVFQMSKIKNTHPIKINPNIKISVIHDSIWNYYHELELVVISILEQGQGAFFDKIPKVININHNDLDEIFSKCQKNKLCKIGFMPWARGNYGSFIEKIKSYDQGYPDEILLFHLNKKDYKSVKDHALKVERSYSPNPPLKKNPPWCLMDQAEH